MGVTFNRQKNLHTQTVKKMRIYNIFYILLLKQNTIKKGQINDIQLDFEFEVNNNKKYKVDGI